MKREQKWQCPHCREWLRGDVWTCPSCGRQTQVDLSPPDWVMAENTEPVEETSTTNLNGELIAAIVNADLEEVKRLVQAGADLNHSEAALANTPLHTPLHCAAIVEYADIAEYLLLHGAHVDARNESGNTPLVSAVVHENHETARVLVEHGADIRAKQGPDSNTPIFYAAQIPGMQDELLEAEKRRRKHRGQSEGDLEREVEKKARAQGMTGRAKDSDPQQCLKCEAALDRPNENNHEASAVCDICSQPTSTNAEGKVFTNEEIRRATERGFNGMAIGPNAAMLASVGINKNDVYREWKHTVMLDTTDWLLCPQCHEEIRRYDGREKEASLSRNDNVPGCIEEVADDWYAPGYWDLPGDVVESLESAREWAYTSGFNGPDRAIDDLLSMDPKIGKPLRHALACCLSIGGTRRANKAIEEDDSEPAEEDVLIRVQRDFYNGILNNPTGQTLAERFSPPNPTSSRRPPCPGCGSTSYVAWAEYGSRQHESYPGQDELRVQPLWLCDQCRSERDRQVKSQERRQNKLRERVRTSLQYLLLANEVDPDDTEIKSNLEALKKTAGAIGCEIPATTSLRERFGEQKVRGTRLAIDLVSDARTCHFCGAAEGGESSQITVPMCGDIQPTQFLLDTGFEYHYADAIVPRCNRCHDEHQGLAGQIEEWHEAKLAAADNEHFPDEMKAAMDARDAARPSAARFQECRRLLAEAQAAMEEAKEIGQKCDRCGLSEFWADGLCQECDRGVRRLGTRSYILILAVLFVSVIVGVGLSHIQPDRVHLIPLIVVGSVASTWWVLELVRHEKEQALRRQHLAELPRKRHAAMVEAKKQIDDAKLAMREARLAATGPQQKYREAVEELQRVKQRAIADFERTHPKPTLAFGIKPEPLYMSFSRIKELRQRGWGFGYEVDDTGAVVAVQPVNVTGLVSREPHLAKK